MTYFFLTDKNKSSHSCLGDKKKTTTTRASPTFVHAREAVLQHSELVDLAELLEEGPEVLLVQVAGDLTDEEFDGIVVLHGDGGRAPHRAVAVA